MSSTETGQTPVLSKLCMARHVSVNPWMQEVEAAGSGVQDNLWLYSKFKVILDPRACVNKEQNLGVTCTFIQYLKG